MTPVYPPDLTPEQEAAFLAERQQRDIPALPDGTPRQSFVKDSESSEVKAMGHLFDAWRIDSAGQIRVDRSAAEDLKRNQFRALRKPLLEELDVKFMRAMEDGDTATINEVRAAKQVLRDVTLIDLTQYATPQTLSAFVPKVLNQD